MNDHGHRTASGSNQAGFTFIELLVTIVIVGILAAIAIPVYLSQRDKSYKANIQDDLHNAAVAEESFLASHQTYTVDLLSLIDPGSGYKKSPQITMTPKVGGSGNIKTSYCLEAFHGQAPADIWHLDSASSPAPALGPC